MRKLIGKVIFVIFPLLLTSCLNKKHSSNSTIKPKDGLNKIEDAAPEGDTTDNQLIPPQGADAGSQAVQAGGSNTKNPANQTGSGMQGTSSADSGATAGGRDCRDDYPTFPWVRQAATECTKAKDWMTTNILQAPFVACKIGNECFRFATADNCNYANASINNAALSDPKAYCRKDYKNYSFFRCFVGGKTYIFQTTNATNYYNFADKQGDVVAGVASGLPIPGGCPIKDQ